MTLIVAGERSGVGKTTVTLALLSYLCHLHVIGSNHSKTKDYPTISPPIVQSFKVGPDYIDPMFHHYVTGRACRNLDPILTSEDYVRHCYQTHAQSAEFVLIEGVMGLFDGASGDKDRGSTAHIARLLHVPVLLVLDCSRLSRSVAAIAHGFRSFDPSIQLAGVVLNRVGSDRHLTMLKEALHPLDLPILGTIRREENISLPDRHLGLVPTDELPEIDGIVERLAQLGQSCFDWGELLPLLGGCRKRPDVPDVRDEESEEDPVILGGKSHHQRENETTFSQSQSRWKNRRSYEPIKIGVARDQAFNFYYADNLDMLVQQGAEIVEWSPMVDHQVPRDISGLYFGGGFPEVFAAELSQNRMIREAVRQAIVAGMPTYAECGGLMYLCETLIDFEEASWDMVGVLPTAVRMGKTLSLGYRRAIARHDGPMFLKGTVVFGHEFHRSSLDEWPEVPCYEVQSYHTESHHQLEGWNRQNLHASYIHLHWGDRPEIPARFIAQCQIWSKRLSNEVSPVEN